MIDNLYQRFNKLFVDKQNTVDDVNQHRNLTKPLFWMLLFAVIAMLVLIAIDFYILKKDSISSTALGTFGDFFGGVLNPILTFLTFFGLIITIVIQRMELRLAREEYEKTAIALNTQAIESTFFNTLELHHKIVDGLKYDPNKFSDPAKEVIERMRLLAGSPAPQEPISNGRDVFDSIANVISRYTKNPQEVLRAYKELQDHQNQILGHYFRNLYQAIKIIDSYDDEVISQVQKEKYTGILRAQLSTNELVLLYLNCCESVVDHGQFRNLLIKYKMLEHLPLTESNGVYFAGNRNLAVADRQSILQYLSLTAITAAPLKAKRGAFGNNPASLPCLN